MLFTHLLNVLSRNLYDLKYISCSIFILHFQNGIVDTV